jgi:hypothetical protein
MISPFQMIALIILSLKHPGKQTARTFSFHSDWHKQRDHREDVTVRQELNGAEQAG